MIDDLKHENHELKHENETIEGMEETLHSAQYALDKATGDRLKLENDFKIQVDNDAITVNRLKNEGIDLKHTLADRNEEIARLRSTLSNLKYTLDLKRGDSNHLGDEFGMHKDDHDHLKEIANRLDKDVKVEVEINDGLKKELDDLHGRIRHHDDDHNNHHNKIRQLEDDNIHSREHQNSLERSIDDVERKIRDISAQLNVLEGKARNFKIDLDHLENTVGDLTGKNDAEHDLYNNIHGDLQSENDKGRALNDDHHKLVESIERARTELDEISRSMHCCNTDLEYQINELNRHIEVLTKQNHQLNEEIHDILALDKKVKEELDRRAALMEKQRQLEDELKKSLNDVNKTRHSSPRR